MKKTTTNKKNGGHFFGGALVGSVLGVAAGLLLAPESGKKMRGDVKKMSGEFYRHIAPQVKKMKKIGEAEYNELVTKGAHHYAKAKKLSTEEAKVLAGEAKKTWKHLKKHL